MQAEHVLGDGSVRHRAPSKYRQGDDNEDFHKRGSQLADEPFPFVAILARPVCKTDRPGTTTAYS